MIFFGSIFFSLFCRPLKGITKVYELRYKSMLGMFDDNDRSLVKNRTWMVAKSLIDNLNNKMNMHEKFKGFKILNPYNIPTDSKSAQQAYARMELLDFLKIIWIAQRMIWKGNRPLCIVFWCFREYWIFNIWKFILFFLSA